MAEHTHPALAALRRIGKTAAHHLCREAIPALEALIAERAELRGALGNLLHFTAPATDGIDPVALRRSRAAAIALLAKGVSRG